MALLDAEKQHGVGNAARGADGNALLRGGGRQQSGDEREGSKGGKGGTNHARTIAKAEPIRPLRCHPLESGDPYAVRYRGAAEYGSRPSLTLGRDDSWCYFKFPQKRWMRVQAVPCTTATPSASSNSVTKSSSLASFLPAGVALPIVPAQDG